MKINNFQIIAAVLALTLFVGSASALEISITVPEKYQGVCAGDRIYFEVVVKDKDVSGRHDIKLNYEIRKDNNTIASLEEVMAIDTQASFISSIQTPEDSEEGMYTVVAAVGNSSSSTDFYVRLMKSNSKATDYGLLILITVIFVGILIWWEIHKIRKDIEKGRKR